jgi:hypothetical protein
MLTSTTMTRYFINCARYYRHQRTVHPELDAEALGPKRAGEVVSPWYGDQDFRAADHDHARLLQEYA